MAARAIWKGIIRCDDFRLPVRLYSAVQDRSVHFRLLHDQDQVRVRQRLVNSVTGESVEYKQARRGSEVERGIFVMLNEDELSSLEPEASRDIDVICFLDPDAINHQWYERPYYLGPDGENDSYFALVGALQQEEKEGVARWVMRRKEYVGALRAEGDYLALITLRHADEVIPASALEAPTGRDFQPREASMAEQLLQALDDTFRPGDYHDEHRQRVLDLIAAKQRGETIEFEEPEERRETDALADALKASLKARK
jgi:DNA end-binding protein Ku